MSVIWYYSVQGNRVGPLSWDAIQDAVHSGQLGPEDFIWSPSLGDDWQKAGSFTSLFPQTATSTSPTDSASPDATNTSLGSTDSQPQTPFQDNVQSVSIEVVQLPSPFLIPEEPSASATSEAAQPVSCLKAARHAWNLTQHYLFTNFSFSRWFLFMLCVLLMTLFQSSPITTFESILSNPTHVQRFHLEKVAASQWVNLKINPSLRHANARPEEQIQQILAAVHDTAHELLVWFHAPDNVTIIIGLCLASFLLFLLASWFYLRGNILFIIRLYLPDSPFHSTWLEAKTTSRNFFWGFVLVRFFFTLLTSLVVLTGIKTLGSLPASDVVFPARMLQFSGASFALMLFQKFVDRILMDFVLPITVLQHQSFGSALKSIQQSFGLWILRYGFYLVSFLVVLSLLFAVLFAGLGNLATFLFAFPPLTLLLFLPPILWFRLWTLHILFDLKPTLRKAVPSIRIFRIR